MLSTTSWDRSSWPLTSDYMIPGIPSSHISTTEDAAITGDSSSLSVNLMALARVI